MHERQRLGAAGEDAVAREYRARGYTVLARNWTCRIGELDLILARGGVLVFCEVKTRRGARFGGGFDAVTADKQRKLRQVAAQFLAWAHHAPRASRFDVASVAITGTGPGRFDVHIFEDAF